MANGHDMIELLFEYCWIRGGVKLHSKEDDVAKFGARLLSACVDLRSLVSEPLFARLRSTPLPA